MSGWDFIGVLLLVFGPMGIVYLTMGRSHKLNRVDPNLKDE